MKEFVKLRKMMDNAELSREQLITQSREVVKLSKTLIYALHQNNMNKAVSAKKDLESAFSKINNKNGPYKIAAQEYVEAIAYDYYHHHKKLMPFSKFKLDPDMYLLGICDLTGELGRRAVNAVINDNRDEFYRIKDIVINIYQELLLFDFRNNELRKKVDSMKYEVKKFEEIALQLKLK